MGSSCALEGAGAAVRTCACNSLSCGPMAPALGPSPKTTTRVLLERLCGETTLTSATMVAAVLIVTLMMVVMPASPREWKETSRCRQDARASRRC